MLLLPFSRTYKKHHAFYVPKRGRKFPKLIIFATTKLLKEGGMCPKDLVGNDYQRAVFF